VFAQMSRTISILINQMQLSGALHLPENIKQKKVPLILILHGFVGNKVGEHRLFVKAARYFTKKGYAVFRFDFSGCGESDGDYADVTVTKQLAEVQAVLNYVSKLKEVDANKITLVGHSLGGTVASITAAEDCRIKNLILWSPVGRPYEDITGILGEQALEVSRKNGLVDYKGFYVSELFLKDLKKHRPLEAIRSYKNAALIIHANEDEDIPKEHAARYLKVLQQRAIQVRVDAHYVEKADHTFSSYQFENELFSKSADWLEECLVSDRQFA